MVGKFLPAALPLYTVAAFAFMYWTTKYTDYNSLLQFRLWRRAERYVITQALISRHCFGWVFLETVKNWKILVENLVKFLNLKALKRPRKTNCLKIQNSLDRPKKSYSGVCWRLTFRCVCRYYRKTVYEVLKRYFDVEHIWKFPLKSLTRG